MKKVNKWIILLIFIVGIFISNYREDENAKPELVSTINSMNHEYCSIIIHKKDVHDKENLARFLIESCRENAFENIKFATDVRGYPSGVLISVYLTKKDFELGNQYMSVRCEMIEYSKSSNIRDNMDNYRLYVDNELIEYYEQS